MAKNPKKSRPKDSPPRLEPDAVRRIEEGASRGRRTLSADFATAMTRKRFCSVVGIHETTLRRWEAAKIVRPEMVSIRGIGTWVFNEADVAAGRKIARLLQENSGRFSLEEAAAAVAGQGSSPAASRRHRPRRKQR